MPHRLAYLMESFAAALASLGVAASSFLLGQVDVSASPAVIESAMEMRLISVPLIGGVLTMLGAVFLNPSAETANIKIGRACFGVFVCLVAPQVLAMVHPSLKDVTTRPLLLLGIGGLAALAGFIFSRPAVVGIYRRSGRLSEEALDRAEAKYLPPKTKDNEP
jgi:hypothetical protein